MSVVALLELRVAGENRVEGGFARSYVSTKELNVNVEAVELAGIAVKVAHEDDEVIDAMNLKVVVNLLEDLSAGVAVELGVDVNADQGDRSINTTPKAQLTLDSTRMMKVCVVNWLKKDRLRMIAVPPALVEEEEGDHHARKSLPKISSKNLGSEKSA